MPNYVTNRLEINADRETVQNVMDFLKGKTDEDSTPCYIDFNNIITAGTKITGNINLSCNLYIDGYFEGNINSEQEINIGKNGKIKGEITALRVIVQGLAEGSINATRVDIKPDGKVTGSIESEEFVIEAKGIFEGNSLVKTSLSEKLKEKKEDFIEKEDIQ
jgi:cytoskeletal protein CcmA (bactofilin family)